MDSQTSEHLSVEELQRMANKAMRKFISVLEKTGGLDASILMVMPDDSLAALPFPPEIMNIGLAKQALFMAMREFALERKAKAVIFSSDTFFHYLSSEEIERLKTDKEYYARYQQAALGSSSIDDIVAAGFGRKVEAIMVTVQSPLYDLILTQEYERCGADQRHIVLGKLHVMDNTQDDRMTGRFKIWDRGEKEELDRIRRGEKVAEAKPQ